MAMSVVVAPGNAATTLLGVASAVSTTIDQKVVTLTPPRSNSPGKISVVIENSAIARADGLVVTLLSVGTTPITFVQEASGAYNAATRSTRLYVRAGVASIAPWANQNVQLASGTVRLTPPISTSNGSWSYSSSNTAVASVVGDLVTVLDGGTTVIRAVQSATSSWLSGSTSMTLTVLAATPSCTPLSDISFSINSISSFDLKDPVCNSQGSWSYISSDSQIVSIVGKRITALKPGVVTITARQARWQLFKSQELAFKVAVEAVKVDITPGLFTNTTVTLTGASEALKISLPQSTSPGSWSVTSADPTIVALGAISGNREIALTALKPGSVKLSAIQAASGTFGQSQPVEITIAVNAKPLIGTMPRVERVAGDPALNLVFPTSQSKGAWSTASTAPLVADVKNGNLVFGDAGNSTITLTQAADGNWLSASTTFEVRVIGLTPTIGTRNPIVLSIGEKAETNDFPTSNSKGKWIITSDNTQVVSVIDGELIAIAPGSTEISLFQDLAGKFGRSNIVRVSVRVKPNPSFDRLPNINIVLGSTALAIDQPASSSPGTWSFSSGDSKIISLSGNKVTPVGIGTTTVIARQLGTNEFSEVTQSFTVTVTAPPAPRATATASGRKITVNLFNAATSTVAVTINGVKSKVGVNSVGPGSRTVVVKVKGKIVLTKKFQIK